MIISVNQLVSILKVLDWVYFCWNWKHCSEIIFKYVNSTVGLIFNEKVTEKWNLWDLWTVHPCTVHGWLGQIVRLEPKKKKKKKRTKRDFPKRRCANVEPKRALNVILGLLRNLFVHKSWQKLVESVNLANMDTPSSIFVIDLNSRGCFCILEKQNP